jgi:hypothetical protein
VCGLTCCLRMASNAFADGDQISSGNWGNVADLGMINALVNDARRKMGIASVLILDDRGQLHRLCSEDW